MRRFQSAKRDSQPWRSAASVAPSPFQNSRTSGGTKNGGSAGQPAAFFAARVSSGAERLAVGLLGIVLVRRAVRDVRARDDDGGPVRVGHGGLERVGDLLVVVPVDHLRVPAIRLEPAGGVVGEGERGLPLDRDPVVVVEEDEVAEAEVPGEGGRLVRDPLHQVPVAHDAEDPVAEHRVAGAVEPGLGHLRRDRHADARREPLPERPRRRFDPWRVPVLRVPGRAAPPLAELREVLDRQPVTRQVQQRVEEHRAVPGRQDEAVPVGPLGRAGVEPQVPAPEDERHVRRAHRHAGMAGLRLLHPVHGEELDRVDGEAGDFGRRSGSGHRGLRSFCRRCVRTGF